MSLPNNVFNMPPPNPLHLSSPLPEISGRHTQKAKHRFPLRRSHCTQEKHYASLTAQLRYSPLSHTRMLLRASTSPPYLVRWACHDCACSHLALNPTSFSTFSASILRSCGLTRSFDCSSADRHLCSVAQRDRACVA